MIDKQILMEVMLENRQEVMRQMTRNGRGLTAFLKP